MPTRREVIGIGARLAMAPALSSLLSGCSVLGVGGGASASGGALQVAWWGGNDRAQRTQKVMDLYSQKNPKWTFSGQFSDFFSYWDKINTQAAGGALPDVFQMDMRYLGQFVSKGLLADVAKLADTALNLKDFDAGLLSQGKVKDGLYGIPLGGIVEAMLYDQTAIKNAGMSPPTGDETWEEFASYASKLAKALPQGVYPSDDESTNIDPFEVFIRQRNKELYTPEGKPSFTRDDLVDWYQYWADIRKAGACVPGEIAAALFQADTPENTPLVQGKAAFKMRWSNFIGQYQNLTKNQLALLPHPKGGTGTRPGAYLRAGSLFSIPAKSQFVEGAATFVGFFLTDPEAVRALAMDRGVPGSAKARETIKGELSPPDRLQLEFFDAQSKNTTPRAILDPPGAGEIQKALARNALSIPLNGVSVADAASKFIAEAEKSLSA
jgi:multiple sugar transport system substrate-binding protein